MLLRRTVSPVTIWVREVRGISTSRLLVCSRVSIRIYRTRGVVPVGGGELRTVPTARTVITSVKHGGDLSS